MAAQSEAQIRCDPFFNLGSVGEHVQEGLYLELQARVSCVLSFEEIVGFRAAEALFRSAYPLRATARTKA
jgi:hypothetical protein